ncbi:MAG TPA: amidohydrolase family protein [Thermoanaerobaculia bacterium]|nr:amidohydrolase family protein [Thermoanaerobaculia bacterium]
MRADAPGVYAITGGTVHTASGPDIANGIVVIRNGLIEAVGANVAIPRDATTIDVKGAHVYPGLIDAQTSLGFTAATPSRRGGGGGGGERPAEPTSDSLAARNAKLSDDDLDARRATGVTSIVTAPSNGIFNGQSALLNLSAGTNDSRVIKSPIAMQISFNTRPTWTYPDSLMGVMAYIRQNFMDAQQQQAARDVYTRSPAGLRRPAENAALDALQPVLRRDVPVVFIADSVTMMHRAQLLAKEFNLRYIVSGARQGYAMTDDLKSIPVLVSVKWPTAPTDKEDREDQPLRIIRDRQLAPTTPATLAKSGVTFALVSGAGKTGDFIPGIRKAIENGLSADDALRATTIAPARIFGVDRQLGSLDAGKIANVVVSDKPIFDKDAKVKRVFVDGREIRLPSDDKKAAESAAAPIDGTWSLKITAPDGNISMQVTLHAEDGRLTGTFSGDRGSGEIRGGTIDGNSFQFTLSANAQNAAEATDWVFSGTLADKSMSGTVTTTLGKFEFSGSKSE